MAGQPNEMISLSVAAEEGIDVFMDRYYTCHDPDCQAAHAALFVELTARFNEAAPKED